MAGSVKGITIEFRGDTTQLDKALRQINTETRNLDKELKNVDNALKFNPTNVDLWRQKQTLLTQKVEETKTKLDVLKQAQAKMDASGVDKNSQEYRKLQREIIETNSKVKTFEGQLKKIGNVNLRAASEQFKTLGNKLTAAGHAMTGISTAAAAVTAAIGALTVKSGQWADDINTMSKKYRIGTKDLQKYSAAAELVDVDVETIAKSHVKLEKSMSSALKGTGANADAFKTLGVSVTDSNGDLRKADEVWTEVIAALGKVENETQRDTLAMQLMGKSAADLNPLIEDGGKAYEAFGQTIQKYNLDYIDQAALDRANEFNDSLDTMKAIGTLAFQQLGTQLASTLAPAMEKVVDLVGKIAEWFSKLDPKTQTLIAGIGAVVAAVAPLLIGLGKISFAISSIMGLMATLGPAIGGIVTALGPVAIAIAAVIAAGVLLYKNWDKIKATATKVAESVKTTWNNLKTSVVNTANSIKTSVSNAINNLKTSITNAWNSIKTSTRNAWNSVVNAITSPFKSAIDYIKKVVKWFKDLFPIDLKNLFKIKLPHFSWDWSEVGETGIYLPNLSIDWWKKGGIFTKPTLLGGGNGVGEAGAEAVLPLDKLWEEMDKRFGEGGITINVYASDGMDVDALARKIEQRLVQLQKQRTMAYGGV